nr:hypothetical protein [Stenotrophomonas geniculata]
MRAIYLAGGPQDGTVIHSDDLAEIPPQDGYSVHDWLGATEASTWQQGDVVMMVHNSITGEQERWDAAAEGYKKLIEMDPDVGE